MTRQQDVCTRDACSVRGAGRQGDAIGDAIFGGLAAEVEHRTMEREMEMSPKEEEAVYVEEI